MPRTARTLAKLTRPRLHDVLPRERLFDAMDRICARRAACCVVGPPGAGKTTLVSTWLEVRRRRCLWLQADSGDSDPATFFYYLGQAASVFTPKGVAPLPLFTPEYASDLRGFGRRFFRELFTRLPRRAVFVIDNYQEVGAEAAFHALVADAIGEIPEHVSMAIVTRRDPPDVYARLVANERVGFVDWDLLRLTPDESRRIATRRAGLADDRIEDLHRRCGGWAAGLTLLLDRARQAEAVVAGPKDAVPGTLFSYFTGQVFDELAEDERQALMALSFIQAPDAALAEALTGNPDASRLLERLHRRRLFTDRRRLPGSELPAYQFHALFQDFLRHRAAETLGRAATVAIQKRGAELLEAAGRHEDAVALWLSVQDVAAVRRIVLGQAQLLIGHGRAAVLADWIGSLPADVVAGDAWLLFWLGSAEIQRDFDRAREALRRALALFDAMDDAIGQALAIAGIVQSHFFEDVITPEMTRWVEPLSERISAIAEFPSDAVELTVRSGFLLAAMFMRPDTPMIQPCALRIADLLLYPAIEVNHRLSAAIPLIQYFTNSGQIDRGDALMRTGRILLEDPRVTPNSRAMWCGAAGYHLYMNRDPDASAWLTGGVAFAQAEGLLAASAFCQRFLTSSLAFDGEIAAAAALLPAMASQRDRTRPITLGEYHGRALVIALSAGDIPGALDHSRRCAAALRELRSPFFDMIWGLVLSCGLIVGGALEEAQRELTNVRRILPESCYRALQSLLDLAEAHFDFARGDCKSARVRLSAALSGARADSSMVPFLRCYMRVEVLLAEALAADIEPDVAAALIKKWRLRPPDNAAERWPWPVRVRTLGRFEVVVHDVPLSYGKKIPKKALTLLALLASSPDADWAEPEILDALWPDSEGDAGYRALVTTIHRLRQLLGETEAIRHGGGRIGLDSARCWTDVRAFERVVARHDSAVPRDALFNLYRGAFLQGDASLPAFVAARERLRDRFAAAVNACARRCEGTGDYRRALAWYEDAMAAEPGRESFHQGAIRCHAQLGDRTGGLEAFERMTRALRRHQGRLPTDASYRLRDQLLSL